MAGRRISPEYGLKTFTCRRCKATTSHAWHDESDELPRGGWLEISTCTRCGYRMLWRVTQTDEGEKQGELVHPRID